MNDRNARELKLPHVVRFSGGRSSGMMTLKLLADGALDPARGDVVLFNNTGAEAAATYAFVRRIRERVEHAGLPFLTAEFATAEVLHHGRWTRTPTYRLVNERPRTEANPDGYDWQGTTYEELISWSGFTPSYFNRTCTGQLKIETTTRVLDDWLSDTEGPSSIGHTDANSRIDPDNAWHTHVRAGGKRTRESFIQTKCFVWNRPAHREAQRFADFSAPAEHYLSGKGRRYNDAVQRGRRWGTPRRAYISVMGLRNDEWRRITIIETRCQNTKVLFDEKPYMPLDKAQLNREDVDAFWAEHPDNLEAPADVAISNCLYCFLKGTRALQGVRAYTEQQMAQHPELAEQWAGTPCDWRWWAALEARYARTLDNDGETPRTLPREAEATGSPNYTSVLDGGRPVDMIPGVLGAVPCDCTD